MTDADKKLYNKAVEALDQMGAGLTSEIEKYVPAWIDGYKEGLKAKINATAISDCPVKDKWHDLRKDPNDLPTCDCETVTLHENGNKNIQKWKNGNWTNAIIIPVIAWYELLKFEEE